MVDTDIIPQKAIPEAPIMIQGVTGHCKKLKGPIVTEIEVGSRIENFPVYVTEMEDQCLLGSDYFNES